MPSWALAESGVARQYRRQSIGPNAAGGAAMASKDKGGSKSTKKAASQTLKQKRQAKKAKQAGGSGR
jgi:hypothetical protein